MGRLQKRAETEYYSGQYAEVVSSRRQIFNWGRNFLRLLLEDIVTWKQREYGARAFWAALPGDKR